MKPIRNLFFMLFFCVAGVSLVTGCGQKGPLYLPQDDPQPQVISEPAAQPGETEPEAGAAIGKDSEKG